jgi:hypothetical protein
MSGHCIETEAMSHALKRFSLELDLFNIEYFVFFGTLLGLTRDGRPIDNDDDVDLYVNKRHFDTILEIIRSLEFNIDLKKKPNNTKSFLQAYGLLDEHLVRVDFYFYDNMSEKNYLVEHWNFAGKPFDKSRTLRIPKSLVYPLDKIQFQDFTISAPQQMEVICEFLYGQDWKTPRARSEYRVEVIGGRPVRIKGRFLTFCFRSLNKVATNLSARILNHILD